MSSERENNSIVTVAGGGKLIPLGALVMVFSLAPAFQHFILGIPVASGKDFLPFILFSAAGLAVSIGMIAYRKNVRFDGSVREIEIMHSVMLPIWRRTLSSENYDLIRLASVVYAGRNGRIPVFRVALCSSGSGAQEKICDFRSWMDAGIFAESCAIALNLPLLDETWDPPHKFSPSELRASIKDISGEETAEDKNNLGGEIPLSLRKYVKLDGTRMIVRTRYTLSLKFSSLIAAMISGSFISFLVLAFFLYSGAFRKFAFPIMVLFLLTEIPLAVWIAFLVGRRIKGKEARMLRADAQGVELEYPSGKIAIPVEDINDVFARFNLDSRNGKRAVAAELMNDDLKSGIFIKSGGRLYNFGGGFGKEELEWLCTSIRLRLCGKK